MFDDDDYCPVSHLSKRKQCAPMGKHIPNKKEAETLRKIMSNTGLTEKEVRAFKTYRVQLSKAQKEKGTKTAEDRLLLSVVKSATRELKLPLEHPTTLKLIKEKLCQWNNWGKRTYSNNSDDGDIIENGLSLKSILAKVKELKNA